MKKKNKTSNWKSDYCFFTNHTDEIKNQMNINLKGNLKKILENNFHLYQGLENNNPDMKTDYYDLK